MAHNLNFRNNKASMYSLREIPWHGLGTITQECLTAKEVIEKAQLDYNVKKSNGFVKYLEEDSIFLNRKGKQVPNTYFTYRDDTGDLLCSNGKALTKDYNVIQNREAFEFLDSLSQEGDIIYETAGALNRGELIFVSARLPHSLLASSPDKIDQYLLIFLSHDGSSSVVVKFTPIRVVCNNTLTAALSDGSEVRIRHSSNYKDRLENAKIVLGLCNSGSNSIVEKYHNYSNIKLNELEAINLINSTYLDKSQLHYLADNKLNILQDTVDSDIISTRKQNIVSGVYDYYNNGIGQDTNSAKDTLWGFLNAISGFYQNVKEYSSQERKLLSIDKGEAANKLRLASQLSYKHSLI